jgi:hypothetical protein
MPFRIKGILREAAKAEAQRKLNAIPKVARTALAFEADSSTLEKGMVLAGSGVGKVMLSHSRAVGQFAPSSISSEPEAKRLDSSLKAKGESMTKPTRKITKRVSK